MQERHIIDENRVDRQMLLDDRSGDFHAVEESAQFGHVSIGGRPLRNGDSAHGKQAEKEQVR